MKLPRPGGGAVAIGDGRPPAIILDAGLASRGPLHPGQDATGLRKFWAMPP